MIMLSDTAWRNAALNQIRSRLFHPGIGLIYDFVSSLEERHRFDFLPCPEEIALDFPNPCGWSTGMEDCALNNGLMLACLCRMGAGASTWAEQLATGLSRCASVHGVPGFIARGISPADQQSCYSNSSRDQFTLAAYGMWRRALCTDASAGQRHAAAEFLRSVADYCLRVVNLKNRYSLMRLDGGPALVSTLWECDAHEALRLPMIYGMAAQATGHAGYLDAMHSFAAPGVRRTLTLEPEADYWWDMPLLQMQLSLNFFRESRMVPALETDVCRAMNLAGRIALRLLPDLLARAEAWRGAWDCCGDNWRTLPMRMTPATLPKPGRPALLGGRTYLNPVFRRQYHEPNVLLRGIGNCFGVLALMPERTEAGKLRERTERLLANLNLEHFAGNGTVALFCGVCAWDWREGRMEDDLTEFFELLEPQEEI